MQDDLVGSTFGQYRVVELIGRGGMATVYRAYQPSLDRHVALKVLPAYFAHDPTFAERFKREARAIARLDHPNILPIYDFGEHDGITYIVMPLIEGGSLHERMGEPLPLDESIYVCAQLAQALDYAHSRGVIHRDVKPGNVLLAPGDRAFLADFGLAKLAGASGALTRSGMGMGTPEYMSPEQSCALPLDGRSDLYSLAMMLFEMLSGHPPYVADTPLAVVYKQVNDPVPSLAAVRPGLPPAVDPIIGKALAKKPEERFDSAGEFVAALQAEMRGSAASLVPASSAPDVEKLYRGIQTAMAAGEWEVAVSGCVAVLNVEPRYRDVSALLDRCRTELAARRERDASLVDLPTQTRAALDLRLHTPDLATVAGAETALNAGPLAAVAAPPRRRLATGRRSVLVAASGAGLLLLVIGGLVLARSLPGGGADTPGAAPPLAGTCADRATSFGRAESALNEGAWSLARELFASLQDLCPGPDAEARLAGLDVLLAARTARAEGDWGGAIVPLQQLAATDPGFPGLSAALHDALAAGRSALALGSSGQARELCTEALSVRSDSDGAARCLADAQPTATAAAPTRAIALAPPPAAPAVVATAAPVGAASARLLRSDDFSDPARGLFADNQRLTGRAPGAGGQEFQFDYGYRNGSLVGKILGPYPDGAENVVLTAFAPATGLVPGDFAVEVTARAASSPNAAGYGIQIIAAREALYTLEVRPSDGFYRLFPQIAQPRRAPLSGRSPAIARGPKTTSFVWKHAATR